ncbi:acyltransferase family protein [Mammaliicoccus stepanovicii]|uniref:O-acetyltransferase oatA n=1 Tax=Mammaliicoccus stepanovicii TaxID=643214 RepID=A0A239YAM4_9STAP|nr:acyltransferase family protein [Mammaliicoccus stepanovicii]PNZ75477.1 acyltransferase [Mammaliicoccus stepanovicii]GGI43087.1 O-acetyltransferase [Mammaliicoccus stepanovicii]SNV55917.1 O-acetyltransferase oatA [Mammaliicoccus stepanovicii]
MSVEQLNINDSHRTRYFYGLDGLRAIAVIAIIIYHLNPKWLPGGFLGVDTFFIISGYLITSLLLNEYKINGQINLFNFWKKRIKRLLPAVIFMISTVLLYTLLFEHDIIKNVKQDALAAIFYVSNWWYIFHDVSYFDSFKLMPLKHLWSLAIEEQFYIIWPLALTLLLSKEKLKQKSLLYIFLLSLISVILMMILAQPNADNSRVYFGTDTRLQTLLLGVTLAFLWPPFKLKSKINFPLRLSIEIIGLISFSLLLYFIFTVSSSDNWFYFGGIYIISIATLPALASSVHPSTLFSKALGNPVLLWIGQRSYSLYLWHYPVITFINKHFVQGQTPFSFVVLEIILTILLAMFSYRFVEVPFRRNGLRMFLPNKNTLYSTVIRLSICMILLGISVITLFGQFDYLQKPDHKPVQTAFKVTSDHKSHNSLIEPVGKIDLDNKDAKKSNDPAPLFIGDSVMVDIGEELLQTYPDSVIDGKVGRHLSDAIPLAKQKYKDYTKKDNRVVLELGTNGDFNSEDLNTLIKQFGNAKIYLVNTHVPRDWEESVNKKLSEAAKKHKNVELINWQNVANGKSEYFAYDGVHLENSGIKALVNEITARIGN